MLKYEHSKVLRYVWNGGNIGVHASSNKAMEMVNGKYIKWLMDDDLLEPQCLEYMVASMEANTKVGVVMAPLTIIDANDKIITPRFYGVRKITQRYKYRDGDGVCDKEQILRDFLTHDYPCAVPSGVMFRTSALQAAGPWSEYAGFAGDIEMYTRLAASWDFYYINTPLSQWRYLNDCHTARLHRDGLDADMFYRITRKTLADERVKDMFYFEWDKFVRDSLFFCSCRSLLNVAAAVRTRSWRLLINTVKIIIRNDPYPSNWLRLPWWVLKQVFESL
jgi:glycosyltransferase involved in cell wall biosynthesis